VATEAGLELNRMLSEFLSAQHGSDTVMKSVEQLQKQLDCQQNTITTMTASLTEKNTEVYFVTISFHCALIWQYAVESQFDIP
jgi:predicted alpha/beta hydrolase family esterase